MTEEKKNEETLMDVDDEFQLHTNKYEKKVLTVNGKGKYKVCKSGR